MGCCLSVSDKSSKGRARDAKRAEVEAHDGGSWAYSSLEETDPSPTVAPPVLPTGDKFVPGAAVEVTFKGEGIVCPVSSFSVAW